MKPSETVTVSGPDVPGMVLGDATKKLQTISDRAEQLYEKVNDLIRKVEDTQEDLAETRERVESLESELATQRALVEALAREAGVDVDAVVTEAAVEEVESTGGEGDDGPA